MMVSPLFATHLPSSAWKNDIFQTSRFAYSIQALIDPTCDSSQGISTMDAISLEMWSSDYSSGAGGWQANEGGVSSRADPYSFVREAMDRRNPGLPKLIGRWKEWQRYRRGPTGPSRGARPR